MSVLRTLTASTVPTTLSRAATIPCQKKTTKNRRTDSSLTARKCNCAHSPKVRPQVRPPPRANRHKWYTSTYSSRWPRHLEKPLSKYICLSDTYLIVIGVEKTCRPSTSTTPRSTHAHHPSRLYFVLRNTSSGFWEHFRSLQTTTHTTARIPCANHLHRVLT